MAGAGTTRADGGLTMSSDFMDIQNTRVLVNGTGQTANWTAGTVRLLNAGLTLRNEAGASFNITGTSRSLLGNGSFQNNGNLKVALAGTTETLTVNSGVVNDGSVTVQNGTLAMEANASGSGQWQADGGKLQLNANRNVTTSGDIGVSNGGALEINTNATLTGTNLTLDPTATLDMIGNATLSVSGDLSFAMTDETLWSFDTLSTLEMTGGVGAAVGDWGAWGTLEIGGVDIGTDPLNHVGDPLGFSNNFDLAELVIGAGGYP
ncbi:MAG TPA: hypothetical protein ENJ80_08660 [Gammaproteobacteria bacterium]|nr:hypothetical protein [Gammaproteobacteria bacterium]